MPFLAAAAHESTPTATYPHTPSSSPPKEFADHFKFHQRFFKLDPRTRSQAQAALPSDPYPSPVPSPPLEELPSESAPQSQLQQNRYQSRILRKRKKQKPSSESISLSPPSPSLAAAFRVPHLAAAPPPLLLPLTPITPPKSHRNSKAPVNSRSSSSGKVSSHINQGHSSFLARKSVSSPLLAAFDSDPLPLPLPPPPYSKHTPQFITHPPLCTSSSSSTSVSAGSTAPFVPFSPPPLPPLLPPMNSDTEDERDEDGMIYTSWNGSAAGSGFGAGTSSRGKPSSGGGSSMQSLRSRIFGLASVNGPARTRDRDDKPICTTPGMVCAGETETETDEPPRHLPTARIIPASGPLVPPNTLQQRLTPLLFEFSRLLSIVPAIFGTVYNVYHIFHPPSYDAQGGGRPPPERVDFFVSALWSILTGYQCLALTTGLLTRWRLYYAPLSTLVRLLALQGICWPATHLTLTVLMHERRPALTWALIGTTTCASRSVQIWVTSNLWWERREEGGVGGGGEDRVNAGAGADASGRANGGSSIGPSSSMASLLKGAAITCASATTATATASSATTAKRWGSGGGGGFRGGKWGGRRWDWGEVGVKCVLPAGVVYFVMAWAEVLRREWAAAAQGAAGAGAGCRC